MGRIWKGECETSNWEVARWGSRSTTLCPDLITTTVELEQARLERVAYTECIDKPFALRGAYTLEKSFPGLRRFRQLGGQWRQQCGGRILGLRNGALLHKSIIRANTMKKVYVEAEASCKEGGGKN